MTDRLWHTVLCEEKTTTSSHGLSCSAKLHLFDQKYSKNSEILLQFNIAVFYVNVC